MGGDRFRITAYDTASGAGPAAEEAIDEGSGLILGPLLADDVRVVAAIARRADVPVIAFSNDESVAGDGVYLMGITPRQSVGRVVSYARGRGMSRFARAGAGQCLWPARRRGDDAGGRGRGRAADRHSELRARPGRGGGAAGWARRGYDAVLIADGPRVALQIVPVVRQRSPQPRLMATELWATETNIGASVGLRGAWYAAPSDALFGQFSTRYRARYNARPFRLASLGYDSVLLAVRVAANWPVGRAFPERALRDPGGFSGVDGAFRFDRERAGGPGAGGARSRRGGQHDRFPGAARLQLIRTISARIASSSSIPRGVTRRRSPFANKETLIG